jgi:hypothetical protein
MLVLQQLRDLYAKFKILDSTVLLIDMKKSKLEILIDCFTHRHEKDLMNVCRLILFKLNHLLCLLHINNNVLINYKKHFIIKKVWDKFFSEWKEMMYASFESE